MRQAAALLALTLLGCNAPLLGTDDGHEVAEQLFELSSVGDSTGDLWKSGVARSSFYVVKSWEHKKTQEMNSKTFIHRYLVDGATKGGTPFSSLYNVTTTKTPDGWKVAEVYEHAEVQEAAAASPAAPADPDPLVRRAQESAVRIIDSEIVRLEAELSRLDRESSRLWEQHMKQKQDTEAAYALRGEAVPASVMDRMIEADRQYGEYESATNAVKSELQAKIKDAKKERDRLAGLLEEKP